MVELNNGVFENIKHVDENGIEYWHARELMIALKYSKWQNFQNVIKLAKTACMLSKIPVKYQFTEVSKLIIGGKGNKQMVNDYKLSRYACYLIAQNSDSRKKVIALAQTYFAIQTRKQEIYEHLSENDRERLFQREIIRKKNNILNKTAKKAGVKNMDKFHNSGYKGLYNGETANAIFKRKKLRYREDILDNMDVDELIVNSFRISQADQTIKNNNIQSEKDANLTHYNVGKKVRELIISNNNTPPEKMKSPEKSIKEIKKYETKNKLINK